MQNKQTKRLTELQKLLTICPADVLTRSDLALLLEELDRPDEALSHLENGIGF